MNLSSQEKKKTNAILENVISFPSFHCRLPGSRSRIVECDGVVS